MSSNPKKRRSGSSGTSRGLNKHRRLDDDQSDSASEPKDEFADWLAEFRQTTSASERQTFKRYLEQFLRFADDVALRRTVGFLDHCITILLHTTQQYQTQVRSCYERLGHAEFLAPSVARVRRTRIRQGVTVCEPDDDDMLGMSTRAAERVKWLREQNDPTEALQVHLRNSMDDFTPFNDGVSIIDLVSEGETVDLEDSGIELVEDVRWEEIEEMLRAFKARHVANPPRPAILATLGWIPNDLGNLAKAPKLEQLSGPSTPWQSPRENQQVGGGIDESDISPDASPIHSETERSRQSLSDSLGASIPETPRGSHSLDWSGHMLPNEGVHTSTLIELTPFASSDEDSESSPTATESGSVSERRRKCRSPSGSITKEILRSRRRVVEEFEPNAAALCDPKITRIEPSKSETKTFGASLVKAESLPVQSGWICQLPTFLTCHIRGTLGPFLEKVYAHGWKRQRRFAGVRYEDAEFDLEEDRRWDNASSSDEVTSSKALDASGNQSASSTADLNISDGGTNHFFTVSVVEPTAERADVFPSLIDRVMSSSSMSDGSSGRQPALQLFDHLKSRIISTRHPVIRFHELAAGKPREVVAKTLVQILVLGTRGLAQIHQETPYGDISIQLRT